MDEQVYKQDDGTNYELELTTQQPNEQDVIKIDEKTELDLIKPVKPPMTRSEKKYIAVLLTLFFVQGIPLGFGAGMSMLLASNHATMVQQALLSVCYYPYAFKLLAAPFLDSIFSDRIGKRRTYILPCQYILGACFILMGAFQFSFLIETLQISSITFICFIIIFLSAIQDIAVDGWVLTCLTKNYVHLGSPCQAIGQYIGVLFGSVVFINITSIKFKNYIFGEISEFPILTIDQYCLLAGGIICILTLLIHVLTEETPQSRSEGQMCNEVLRVLKDLKGLFKNSNLKTLCIYLIIKSLGVAPVLSSTGFIFSVVISLGITLVEELGFSKEVLSQLTIFLFPFKAFVSIIVGQYLKRGKELTYQIYAYYLIYLDSIFQFLIIIGFQALGGYCPLTIVLVVFSTLYSECVESFLFCTSGGFFMRISDANVGGSYLTLLASVDNFGDMFAASLSLALLDIFPYVPLVFLFWLLGIVIIVFIKPKLENIQRADLDTWKIQASTNTNIENQ